MWIINTLHRPGNLTLAVILAASMFSVQAFGGSSASPDAAVSDAVSDAVIGGGVDSSRGAALSKSTLLIAGPHRSGPTSTTVSESRCCTLQRVDQRLTKPLMPRMSVGSIMPE
jgi:hypothetical protein